MGCTSSKDGPTDPSTNTKDPVNYSEPSKGDVTAKTFSTLSSKKKPAPSHRPRPRGAGFGGGGGGGGYGGGGCGTLVKKNKGNTTLQVLRTHSKPHVLFVAL